MLSSHSRIAALGKLVNIDVYNLSRFLWILYIMDSRQCFRRCSRDFKLRFFKIIEMHPGVYVRIVVEDKAGCLTLNLLNSVDVGPR